MFRRDAYKFNIVTYMYVRSCCRINTLFTEYRETSLVWCCIVTRDNEQLMGIVWAHTAAIGCIGFNKCVSHINCTLAGSDEVPAVCVHWLAHCLQVERIKERVEEKEGIPPPQQR